LWIVVLAGVLTFDYFAKRPLDILGYLLAVWTADAEHTLLNRAVWPDDEFDLLLSHDLTPALHHQTDAAIFQGLFSHDLEAPLFSLVEHSDVGVSLGDLLQEFLPIDANPPEVGNHLDAALGFLEANIKAPVQSHDQISRNLLAPKAARGPFADRIPQILQRAPDRIQIVQLRTYACEMRHLVLPAPDYNIGPHIIESSNPHYQLSQQFPNRARVLSSYSGIAEELA
jgi:hypothetical protein